MQPKDQDALHDVVMKAYALGEGLPHILRGICIELAERIVAEGGKDVDRYLREIVVLTEAIEKLGGK